MSLYAVSLSASSTVSWPAWIVVLGWAFAVVGWLLLMRQAPFWHDARARRIAITAVIGCALFAGLAYGSQYIVDGHCTQQNWDTLMGNYGYWEALVVWYVIAGC